MVAVATNLAGDNLLLLPARESPYLLQEVYALTTDQCLAEIVFQWSEGGYLHFRADVDTDSLDFDFHHERIADSTKLTRTEIRLLEEFVQRPRTKKKLGAPAKILGAATRPGYGKQGGGLLARGFIRTTGKRQNGSIQYEITNSGRSVLAATKYLGKECGWTWVARDQQGYCDSVMLSFDGIVPSVLLHVIASSIEIFTITRG